MSETDANRAPSGGGQVIALVAAIVLGGWMLFATIAKLLSPQAFVAAVDSYGILPGHLNLAAATGIVGLEMALAIMLITGLFRRTAALIQLPLLILFTVMVVRAIQSGQTDCGCYGEALKIPPKAELWIDIGLIGLTLVVLRWGRNLSVGPLALRHAVAWGSLCLGAVLFLAGNPVIGGEEELDIPLEQLAILSSADPYLAIPDEGLLFFFSTDCNHCWAFAGTVELAKQRLPGVTVAGITYGDPQALEEFEYAFSPSYPIHVMKESMFRRIAESVPVAVWISGGKVEGAWQGFVPSHRELAELAGYEISEGPVLPATAPAAEEKTVEETAGSGTQSEAARLFGGPLKSQNRKD